MRYKAKPTNLVGVELGSVVDVDDAGLLVQTASMREWAEEFVDSEVEPDVIVVSVVDSATQQVTEHGLSLSDAIATARDLIIALAISGDPIAERLLHAMPCSDEEFEEFEDEVEESDEW
tara:strand:- start:763 stop:1119 length:357 start_codon:yes stop_codon:yes gene_type:complete